MRANKPSRSSKRLLLYKKRSKLSYRDLAKKLDCGPQHVHGWANGRTAPVIDSAIKVCKLTKGYVTLMGWVR